MLVEGIPQLWPWPCCLICGSGTMADESGASSKTPKDEADVLVPEL